MVVWMTFIESGICSMHDGMLGPTRTVRVPHSWHKASWQDPVGISNYVYTATVGAPARAVITQLTIIPVTMLLPTTRHGVNATVTSSSMDCNRDCTVVLILMYTY